MNKTFFVIALPVTLLVLSGCYNYSPPPVPTEDDTFTQKSEDKRYQFPEVIKVLKLKEAQDLAIRNNPDFETKYQSIIAARARYYQSLSNYLPQITSSYVIANDTTSNRHQTNQNLPRTTRFTTDASIRTTWLVFDGLARTMGMLAAKHSTKLTEADRDNSRRIYLQLVATSYNDILLAIEQRRIAIADMDFQMDILRETEIKYKAGAVPLSDVLNFKIQLNTANGSLISAAYRYNISRYALATLMGVPAATLPENLKFPPINTNTDGRLTSIGVYLDAALNNRPDLKYYREAVKISEYTLYQRWGAFSPRISIFGEYGYGTNYNRFGSTTAGGINHTKSNTSRFGYGAEATLSIFEGGAKFAAVREAQALVAAAKFQTANIWITVVKEVRGAHDNYIQNVKLAKLFEKTLGLVTKQRDLVAEEYKAGNTELTRLNEAQRDLVSADTDFVIALVNLQNAKAQLLAATNSNTIGMEEYKDEWFPSVKGKDGKRAEPTTVPVK
ncbi:MAG: TolC family protein [Victivallaceae bacterium]|nr:TolC family protein [Victivallaceae bacterium]